MLLKLSCKSVFSYTQLLLDSVLHGIEMMGEQKRSKADHGVALVNSISEGMPRPILGLQRMETSAFILNKMFCVLKSPLKVGFSSRKKKSIWNIGKGRCLGVL